MIERQTSYMTTGAKTSYMTKSSTVRRKAKCSKKEKPSGHVSASGSEVDIGNKTHRTSKIATPYERNGQRKPGNYWEKT